LKQESGNWRPYNAEFLERNILQVFKTGDIGNLNKATYLFITAHMGFIAHYDLHGFQCEYEDIELFRLKLQTSEYSRNPNYNLEWAERYQGDRQFNEWYGPAYCRSVAQGIRRIVAATKTQGQQLEMALLRGEVK